MAEGQPQPVDDQRAAMRDGDTPAYAGRPEIFPPLNDPQQSARGALVQAQQPYHL
jgi:hypothetical protein